MNKNILIIKPRYGLCNQLSSISKGIIYAYLSNRDIIFNGFQLDYRHDDNLLDFQEVINIDELQKTINKFNLNVKITSNKNIVGKKIDTGTNEEISHIKDFIPYLFLPNNVREQILDIGNPITSIIPIEHMKLQNAIECEITFSLKYNIMANNIIEKIKLKDYICLHLRLEDDAINYMKILKGYENTDLDAINIIYKNKYLERLGFLKNNKIIDNQMIYICTSLGIDRNINNDFYKDIKKEFGLIDKTDIMNINILEDCKCREIYAIIDFIIAKKSTHFIGIDWSSFSLQIYNSHLANNKLAELINVWSEINK
jgi:hypothetical protein